MEAIQLNNYDSKRTFNLECVFLMESAVLLEQLYGILEKVAAILANLSWILEQSRLFLEQWKDILELLGFIRTNKNILEHFHLY